MGESHFHRSLNSNNTRLSSEVTLAEVCCFAAPVLVSVRLVIRRGRVSFQRLLNRGVEGGVGLAADEDQSV
jgi:hypothetical protein